MPSVPLIWHDEEDDACLQVGIVEISDDGQYSFNIRVDPAYKKPERITVTFSKPNSKRPRKTNKLSE